MILLLLLLWRRNLILLYVRILNQLLAHRIVINLLVVVMQWPRLSISVGNGALKYNECNRITLMSRLCLFWIVGYYCYSPKGESMCAIVLTAFLLDIVCEIT